MRREERVTVQGPVKEQQPDGMSHRGGGDMDARRRRGGGGLEKWGSVSGPLFCVRTDVGAKGTGTQKVGPKKFFPPIIPPPPPHLSSQTDQRDVGIILSHRCWFDPPPPPGTAGLAPLP